MILTGCWPVPIFNIATSSRGMSRFEKADVMVNPLIRINQKYKLMTYIISALHQEYKTAEEERFESVRETSCSTYNITTAPWGRYVTFNHGLFPPCSVTHTRHRREDAPLCYLIKSHYWRSCSFYYYFFLLPLHSVFFLINKVYI